MEEGGGGQGGGWGWELTAWTTGTVPYAIAYLQSTTAISTYGRRIQASTDTSAHPPKGKDIGPCKDFDCRP